MEGAQSLVRWQFPEPSAAEENGERSRIIERIDEWWRVFASREADLKELFAGRQQWDLAGWMEQHLQAIDDRLMWEFSPERDREGYRLVITPESDRQLRPMVGEILRRAARTEGWEFGEYRLAGMIDTARAAVEAKCGGSIDGWRVHAKAGALHFVDLKFFVPDLRAENTEHAIHVAFVAGEALLGEEMMEKWIGTVEVAPAKAPFRLFGKRKPDAAMRHDAVPIEEMRDRVDRVIAQIRSSLPARPLHEGLDEDGWVLGELAPSEARDYAEQDDRMTVVTPDSELSDASRQPCFYDERFSRCGETFCYLKLDGTVEIVNEEFEDRGSIETALDELLKPRRLGCVVGGGHGLKYSYIEFALTDVDGGVRAIRERLRAGRVTNRAWILFHNADLRGEWIGVYEDSPAPMMKV